MKRREPVGNRTGERKLDRVSVRECVQGSVKWTFHLVEVADDRKRRWTWRWVFLSFSEN